jgi:hypothetical protein
LEVLANKHLIGFVRQKMRFPRMIEDGKIECGYQHRRTRSAVRLTLWKSIASDSRMAIFEFKNAQSGGQPPVPRRLNPPVLFPAGGHIA